MSYDLDQADRHIRSIGADVVPMKLCKCGVRLCVPGKDECGICESRIHGATRIERDLDLYNVD